MPLILIFTCSFFFHFSLDATLIAWSAAGDMYTPGRVISQQFERGISLQIITALEKKIQEKKVSVSMVTINPAGSSIIQEEKAHRINILPADFAIEIQCYLEPISPCITIYHYGYEPFCISMPNSLFWCPLEKSYIINFSRTKSYSETLIKILQATTSGLSVTVQGPFFLPLSSLRGIVTPCLILEFGLTQNDSWVDYIDALAESIIQLCPLFSSQ